MQDVVEMMIKISETSRAQSAAGTLSKNKSGNGPYFVRSGTRSWTKAKDVVVRNQLAKRKTSAEQRHKGDPSTKWIQTIPASGSPEANQNEGPAKGEKKTKRTDKRLDVFPRKLGLFSVRSGHFDPHHTSVSYGPGCASADTSILRYTSVGQ